METKENLIKRRGWLGGKHKKMILMVGGLALLAIIALSVESASWKMREARNRSNMMPGWNNDFGRGQMMNKGKNYYSSPVSSDSDDQFVLPEDALKSGELAIIVSDLESANKAVSDIAANNNGSVYATFISYVSNSIRHGSIVVQVPVSNFDGVFGDLKKIGKQVVQEKTQQISPRNYYPLPMESLGKNAVDQDSPEQAVDASDSEITADKADSDVAEQSSPVSISEPEIAIYPDPSQSQLAQDKGYIRVVFVDYGPTANNGETRMQKQNIAGNVFGVGNPTNQDRQNKLLIVVGIKLILLIALIGLLVVIFKKIFNRIRRRKEDKKVVHVVRQIPKTRARVVRIQRKK